MSQYLKGARQFNKYDLYAFLAGKTLVLTGTSVWKDYNTKDVKGTRVELTITRDDTKYQTKNGEQISNLYNKLYVKVPGTVNITIGTEVEIVDGKAKLYGNFGNELSIEAATVRSVTAPPANNGGKA